jgi:high-affinity iron transporter
MRRALVVVGVLPLVLAVVATAGTAAPPPAVASAQTVLQMLDYVAVDYPATVKDGAMTDAAEYQEQVDFVTQVIATLAELPERPERTALVGRARELLGLIEAKRPGSDVARLAGEIRWAVIKAYDVPVAPSRPPDLSAAAPLFAARCAACHGAEGRGDGAAGRALDPPPTNFHDAERLDRRSAYSLYSTITLGVRGTAMPAFVDLTEEQRWALAFHVANLGVTDTERRRGAALWDRGQARTEFGDLASIATATVAEARERSPEAAALLAYLRTRPELLAPAHDAALERSRRLLGESVEAYRAGRARQAQDLAVAGYLDGFELAEASLDAVDPALRVKVETEMIRYRALIRDGASVGEVEAQAARLLTLIAEAEKLLAGDGLGAGPAFVSSFTILVREGLEAILIVAALIALLVRSDRRDALPAVHAGWIVALALGALTWLVASYAITISGATREVTEGVTALTAAAVLLYVGFWMHDKSHADRWQAYLRERVRGALDRRATWGLAAVSFLAVYREVFETVLFYQALWLQTAPPGRHALLAGLGAGAAALALLSWLIVRGGLRVPIGTFFGVASAVVAVLAVVLVGKGIAALQEAAVLAHYPVAGPRLPVLGVYPDLLGLLLQLAVIVGLALGVGWRSHARRALLDRTRTT